MIDVLPVTLDVCTGREEPEADLPGTASGRDGWKLTIKSSHSTWIVEMMRRSSCAIRPRMALRESSSGPASRIASTKRMNSRWASASDTILVLRRPASRSSSASASWSRVFTRSISVRLGRLADPRSVSREGASSSR